MENRLQRLQGEIAKLPIDEDEDEPPPDDRYEGELEEQAVLRDDRAVLEDELELLKELLAMNVRRDKKLDELLGLIDQIEQESPRGAEEKVLIFTEYRGTQAYLVRELEKKYGRGAVVVIHGNMKLDRREEAEQDVEDVWAPFAKDGALVAATTKRTSQRLFRDHPKVRFLVSTEAGGEGINLQFCHICVNYDVPWNPMRVEQRVGRVYRYGQTKVVQVYNFYNKGTIEEKVQSYFENRLAAGRGRDHQGHRRRRRRNQGLAERPARKRGRQPGLDLRARNGRRQPEQGIAARDCAGGPARQQAYEIATRSLFKSVSSYSFDNYRREIKTELSLADLQTLTERFLAKSRRQLKRKDGFLDFLVPEALKPAKLPERYQNATFDRQTAIERSDADFLAIGHPFVDAMLAHVGSYDFGGLAAARRIPCPTLAGRKGFLFVFVVRRRIAREDGDEYLFRVLAGVRYRRR